VNVIGEPVRPETLAVTVFDPAAAPSLSEVDAVPCAPVAADAGVTVPPPAVTANATVTPETGFMFASITVTTNGLVNVAPTDPLWLLPDVMTICVAAPTAVLSAPCETQSLIVLAFASRDVVSAPSCVYMLPPDCVFWTSTLEPGLLGTTSAAELEKLTPNRTCV